VQSSGQQGAMNPQQAPSLAQGVGALAGALAGGLKRGGSGAKPLPPGSRGAFPVKPQPLASIQQSVPPMQQPTPAHPLGNPMQGQPQIQNPVSQQGQHVGALLPQQQPPVAKAPPPQKAAPAPKPQKQPPMPKAMSSLKVGPMPKSAKEPPLPKAIPQPNPLPAPKPPKESLFPKVLPAPKEPPVPKAAPTPKEPLAPKMPKDMPLPNLAPAPKALKAPSPPKTVMSHPGPTAPQNIASGPHPPGAKEDKFHTTIDKAEDDFGIARAKGEAEAFGRGVQEVHLSLSSCLPERPNSVQSQTLQSHSETRQESYSNTQSFSAISSHNSSFMELTDARKFTENWMPLQGKEDHKCGSMFDTKGQSFDGWMSADGDMCDKEGTKLEGKACEMFNQQGEQVYGWMKDDGVFHNDLGERMEGFEVCDSEGKKIELMRKEDKAKKVSCWLGVIC
jgi:hypothetical protein